MPTPKLTTAQKAARDANMAAAKGRLQANGLLPYQHGLLPYQNAEETNLGCGQRSADDYDLQAGQQASLTHAAGRAAEGRQEVARTRGLPPSRVSTRNDALHEAESNLAISDSHCMQVQLELNAVKEELCAAEQARSELGTAMEAMTAVHAVEVQELQEHKVELDAWQQKCAVHELTIAAKEQTILEHAETIKFMDQQVEAYKKLAATAETYASQMETSLNKDVVKEKQTSSHMASKLAVVVALVSSMLAAMHQSASRGSVSQVQTQNSTNSYWNSSSAEIDPEKSEHFGPRSATTSYTEESSSPGEAYFATPEQLQAIRESLEGLKTELLETMDSSAVQTSERTVQLEYEVGVMQQSMQSNDHAYRTVFETQEAVSKEHAAILAELTQQVPGLDDQVKELQRQLSEKNQDLQALQSQVATLEKSKKDSMREADAYANADAEVAVVAEPAAPEVPKSDISEEFWSGSDNNDMPEASRDRATAGLFTAWHDVPVGRGSGLGLEQR